MDRYELGPHEGPLAITKREGLVVFLAGLKSDFKDIARQVAQLHDIKLEYHVFSGTSSDFKDGLAGENGRVRIVMGKELPEPELLGIAQRDGGDETVAGELRRRLQAGTLREEDVKPVWENGPFTEFMTISIIDRGSDLYRASLTVEHKRSGDGSEGTWVRLKLRNPSQLNDFGQKIRGEEDDTFNGLIVKALFDAIEVGRKPRPGIRRLSGTDRAIDWFVEGFPPKREIEHLFGQVRI